MMTNLSHQDHGIPKNNFDLQANKENNDITSIIGNNSRGN